MQTLCCCAGEIACCAGSLCCRSMCCACQACGVTNKNFSKIGYVFFDIFFVSLAVICLFTFQDLIDYLPSSLQCPEASGGSDNCFGPSAIIRMSFCLFIFHLGVLVIICSKSTMAAMFHDGCWTFKMLIVTLMFIISLYIDNEFFKKYLSISRWESMIFLFYQAALMLNTAYVVNDTLVRNAEETQGDFNVFHVGMIVLLLLTTGFNIWWIISMFQDFGGSGCSGNTWILILTVIIGLAMYILPIICKQRPDASVLTSSIIFMYCLYLQWSSFISKDDDECNVGNPIPASVTIEVISSGLAFTFLSLIILAGSTQSQQEKKNVTTALNNHLKEDEDEDEKAEDVEQYNNKGQSAEDTHTFAITPATILFQNLLVFASIYYGCLLTNWGNVSLFDDNSANFFENSNTAFWIKLVCLWFTMGLYIFSLLAPLCLDRDFS